MSDDSTVPSQLDYHDDRYEPELKWPWARARIELGLYGAITLLALILAVDVDQYYGDADIVQTTESFLLAVWATAIGLCLAHWFSIALSFRIVSPKPLHVGRYLSALTETYPLLVAAAVASIGGILGAWLGDNGLSSVLNGANIALISMCACIAWAGAHAHRVSLGRRVALTLFVIAVTVGIVQLKLIVAH